MPDKQLVVEAKRLEKLQTKRRKLRKDLRDIEQEIKLVKKLLRGLLTPRVEGPDDPLPSTEKGDQLPPRWKGKVR